MEKKVKLLEQTVAQQKDQKEEYIVKMEKEISKIMALNTQIQVLEMKTQKDYQKIKELTS